MPFAMTKAEREAFLAETHVAVASVTEPGHGPLTVPIWYQYTPSGDVLMSTLGDSKKARLIREAGRMSLCVQTETPPYKYATVEGPATIEGQPDYDQLIKPMAYRYLGEQMGEMYLQTTAEQRDQSVLIRLKPERWITVDYTKMAAEAGL